MSLNLVPRDQRKLGLGDATLLQTAGVRRAWSAVRLYFQQAEQDRSKVALADLGSMLGDSELRDLKTAFWQRYKLRFPSEEHPRDTVVSRVFKELACVFNVWKVKNLQFQLTTVQKKRKLGDNLYTEEAETEELVSKDAETYLDKLYTLMLAYALTGAGPLTGVADPSKEKTLGSNPAEFVEVPVDVMVAYWFRAKRFACMVPVRHRLAWLQSRDTDERSEWVTKSRESSLPLGVVVQQIIQARDAHWVVAATVSGESDPPPAIQPKIEQQDSLFQRGPKINGKMTGKVSHAGWYCLVPRFPAGEVQGHRQCLPKRGSSMCSY